jgi:hypothetical protein
MAAYDVDLLERLREQLADESGLSEQAMFGGVALMLHGNMCVGVMKGGGLMVRLSKDEGEAVLTEPHTREMDMTGRTMKGWVVVEPGGYADDDDLGRWVRRAVAFCRTLPPKAR